MSPPRAPLALMAVCLAGGWPSTASASCASTLQIATGQAGQTGSGLDIYCTLAGALGFPTCPDGNGLAIIGEKGYEGSDGFTKMAEFPMLMGICAAHSECVGIYDYKDDGFGLRLCKSAGTTSSGGGRVWSMPTGVWTQILCLARPAPPP